MIKESSNDKVINLVMAFQAGDEKAFSDIYDMHFNILYNFGTKLTSDKELLKDCIHDVFVKLYTKRTDLNIINNLKSYLFISLKNRICDEYRKNSHLSETDIEDMSPVDSGTDIEGDLLIKEKMTEESILVKNLLEQLSPHQREILTLYYYEEKKYEDICEIMNMNSQSVRNLMHRSITKLRGIINYA